MRKKIIRKNVTIVAIISMLLAMTFFSSTLGVANANTDNEDWMFGNSNPNNSIAKEELSILRDEIFDTDVVESTVAFFDELSNDNIVVKEISPEKIVLTAVVDNKRSEIILEQATDQWIEFRVLEDGKEDLIAFNNKGEIYSEGEKVIVDEIVENIENNESDVEANIQQRVETCPYGSAANYTYNANKKVTKSSTLPKKIIDYTVTGLAAIIAAALTLNVGASIAAAFAAKLIADTAVNQMKTWKSVGKVYYHKNKKKFMVEASIGCQKEATTFYGKKNNGSWKPEKEKTIWLYLHTNGA